MQLIFLLLCESTLCVEVGDTTEGSEGGNTYLAVMEMEFFSTFAENYERYPGSRVKLRNVIDIPKSLLVCLKVHNKQTF